MRIPISERLLACCQFIGSGERVADIGTDHGYLGIWLLTHNVAASVIASDIVPGPLSSARSNAEKYGCSDRMTFFLSDGVENIPRDFDSVVCAGMGADTIISIISAAPWLKDKRYKLVLQCQSKPAKLRRFLSEQGYSICEEVVLRDRHFLYTVMLVQYNSGEILSPGEWYISPALLRSGSPELPSYYKWVLRQLRNKVDARKDTSELLQALIELESIPNDPNYSYLSMEESL